MSVLLLPTLINTASTTRLSGVVFDKTFFVVLITTKY